MDASELLELLSWDEMKALPADKRADVWGLLAVPGPLHLYGAAGAILIDTFGSESETVQAVFRRRFRIVSRAEEIKLPPAEPHWVERLTA